MDEKSVDPSAKETSLNFKKGLCAIRFLRASSMLCLMNVLVACTIDGAIVNLGEVTIPSLPGQTDPRLKTSSLPTNVPEGYPYRGTAQVENISGILNYSLVDSTCSGLQVNSSSGLLTGVLNHRETETCSYKVKVTSSLGLEYLSELVTLTFTPALNFSFSSNQLGLLKGGTSGSVSLNISPAPPFDSEIEYSLFSSSGADLDYLNAFGAQGTINLFANQGIKELNLQVPNTAGFVGTEYQILALQTGSSSSKPQLNLNLSELTPPQFDQVSGGTSHTCGIDEGKLYCWGSDYYGQIGNGATTGDIMTPLQIETSSSWQAISAGSEHTCGIDGGKLYCWGRDYYDQIGNGATTNDVVTPLQIETSSSWQAISAGSSHTCGIDGGKLYCWGSASFGKLGNGTTIGSVVTPLQIGTSATWQAISAGNHHTCGIDGGKLTVGEVITPDKFATAH